MAFIYQKLIKITKAMLTKRYVMSNRQKGLGDDEIFEIKTILLFHVCSENT